MAWGNMIRNRCYSHPFRLLLIMFVTMFVQPFFLIRSGGLRTVYKLSLNCFCWGWGSKFTSKKLRVYPNGRNAQSESSAPKYQDRSPFGPTYSLGFRVYFLIGDLYLYQGCNTLQMGVLEVTTWLSVETCPRRAAKP